MKLSAKHAKLILMEIEIKQEEMDAEEEGEAERISELNMNGMTPTLPLLPQCVCW